MTTPLNDAATNSEGSTQQQATNEGADKTAVPGEGATQQQTAGGDANAQPAEGDKKPAEGGEGNTDVKQGAEGDGKGEKEGDKTKADDKKADDKKPAAAPEKYEDFKLAEGVKLTPEVQGKFEAIARELNLPQESAQKLIDLAPELNKAYTTELVAVADKTSNQWAEETKKDKEIGGGGDVATLNANLALAAKARNAFASPELLALLNKFDAKTNPNGTGLGNHPEVVRHFVRLGRSISEDNKLVVGTAAQQGQAAAADKLYANSTSKK